MSIYNTEGDRGRLEGLASAFVEDGVLETPTGVFEGRVAIVEALFIPGPSLAQVYQ